MFVFYLSIVFDAPRGVGVIATTIATFLRSVDASSGVIGGHHPSAHALSYILSPHSLHNSTIGGSGGQSLEYGGFTEENFEGESQLPPVPHFGSRTLTEKLIRITWQSV